MDPDEGLGDIENRPPAGLIVSNRIDVKLEQLLNLINWPTDPISKICRVILSNLDDNNVQDDGGLDDSRRTPELDKSFVVPQDKKSLQSYRILWMATQQCLKPSVISNLLCISRQRVYDTLRKARNTQKRINHNTSRNWMSPHRSKDDVIQKVRTFVEENVHNFFSCADVRRNIGVNPGRSGYPSTSTVRSILKRECHLSFKKVNLRFKPKWTSEDLAIKTRHVWLMTWLLENRWTTIHIDEFNISSTSIKSYAWSRRGSQNYWFAGKRGDKINCILAVGEVGPIHLDMQKDNVNREAFWNFLKTTIEKLRKFNTIDYSKTLLIYDNASVHKGADVDSLLGSNSMLAVTLPPYTPEFSEAEIAINVVKSKIDRKLKTNRYSQVEFILFI